DPAVTGIDVGLARKAATSKKPAPAMIGLEDPRTLVVDVQIGRIKRGLGTEGDQLIGADVDPTTLDSGWKIDAEGTPVEITHTARETRPTDTGHRGENGDDTLFPVVHRIRLTLAKPY